MRYRGWCGSVECVGGNVLVLRIGDESKAEGMGTMVIESCCGSYSLGVSRWILKICRKPHCTSIVLAQDESNAY